MGTRGTAGSEAAADTKAAAKIVGRCGMRAAEGGRWTRAAALAAVLFGAGLLLVGSGCSTREESPTLAADSTLVYAGKDRSDVEASITFSDKAKVSRRTGKRLGTVKLPAPGQYGMMGYLHQGRQYVVVQVASGTLPGSLVALRLPAPKPAVQ